MSFLLRLIGLPHGDRRDDQKKLLRRFIQINTGNNPVVKSVAKHNLESAILELNYANGAHLGSALLLSSAGHILTCRHCFVEDLRLNYNGKLYKLVFLAEDDRHDLVLLKANIKIKNHGFDFRFLANKTSHKESAVVCVRRRDNALHITGGLSQAPIYKTVATSDDKYVYDQRFAGFSSCVGDSGAIVTSIDAEILGIHTCGDSEKNSFFTPWFFAFELIRKYCQKDDT